MIVSYTTLNYGDKFFSINNKKTYKGVYAQKSTNCISLRGMISTFFVFKTNKCRGPPLINLDKKNKLIGE